MTPDIPTSIDEFDATDIGSYMASRSAMGLSFGDLSKARAFIETVGIHYFDDYAAFRRMQSRPGTPPAYRPGTSFADVVEAIHFDNLLKDHAMTGIRQIELWLRSELCYGTARALNNEAWHLNDSCLHNHAPLSSKSRRMREEAEKACVKLEESGHDVPLWRIADEMSFGFQSIAYELLHEHQKQVIADKFHLKPGTFEGWIMQLVGVRNICSHHRLLWAGRFSGIAHADDQQIMDALLKTSIKAPNIQRINNVAMRLFVIHHLLRTIDPMAPTWTARLKSIVADSPVLSVLGFREGWEMQREWD